MKPFDKEEQELMESIENEEWSSVENLDEDIKKAKEAARGFFHHEVHEGTRPSTICRSYGAGRRAKNSPEQAI